MLQKLLLFDDGDVADVDEDDGDISSGDDDKDKDFLRFCFCRLICFIQSSVFSTI